MGNKGMMTVEASVVVPIILIIVVTEFFFGLFLIDMSVVKSETMRLADEAAAIYMFHLPTSRLFSIHLPLHPPNALFRS